VPLAQWGGLRLLADGGVLVVQPAGSGAGLQTQVFPDGGSLPLRAFPGVPSLTAATTQGTLYLIADGGYAVLEDGAGLSVEALPPMNLPALNGLAPGGRVTVDGEGRVHFFDDRRWLERVGPSTWRERPLDGEQPPNSTRWVSLVWSSNHGFLSNTDRLEWQRLRPNVRLSASVPAAGLPSGSLRRVWLETVGSAESAAADGGTSQALVLSTWLAGRLVRGTPSPSPLRFEVPQPQLIEIPEDTLTWVIEPEGTNFADRPARLQVDGAQVRFRTFTP
jgi:hypothetical protein